MKYPNFRWAPKGTKKYEDAIDAMEYSILIKTDFESGYLDCADLCLQINRFDQSIEIYKALKIDFHTDKQIFKICNSLL